MVTMNIFFRGTVHESEKKVRKLSECFYCYIKRRALPIGLFTGIESE